MSVPVTLRTEQIIAIDRLADQTRELQRLTVVTTVDLAILKARIEEVAAALPIMQALNAEGL